MYVVQWQKGCTEKSHFTLKSGSFQTGKHIYNLGGGTGHCLYTVPNPGLKDTQWSSQTPKKREEKNLLWGNILDIKKITTNFSVVYVWFFLACIII